MVSLLRSLCCIQVHIVYMGDSGGATLGLKGAFAPPTPKFFIKKLVDIFVNSDPSKFIPSKENILLAPSFPVKILYICIISIYCILKESIK